MKWLAATAVFYTIIPSMISTATASVVDINSNQTGTLAPFTHQNSDATGTTYNISGDIVYDDYVNNTITTATDMVHGGAFLNDIINSTVTITTSIGNPGSFTLQDIDISGLGGAFYNLGFLLIESLSNFTCNNIQADSGAGAIYTHHLTMHSLDNIIFSNNQTVIPSPITTGIDPTLYINNGGAIYSKGIAQILDFGSCSFINNQCLGELDVTTDPTNPKFKAGFGGAIYAEGSVILQNGSTQTKISDNKAGLNGGGIYTNDEVRVDNVNNLIIQHNQAVNGVGGGIYSAGNTHIANCTQDVLFLGNTSYEKGGGIFTLGDVVLSNCSDVKFVNNKSGDYEDLTKTPQNGAGIYTTGDFSATEIYTTLGFNNNKASGKGGGLYTNECSISDVNRLQIVGNLANSDGGGIYANKNITLTNLKDISLFDSNISKANGGAIAVASNNSLNITNFSSLTISNNQATNHGGGIYASDKFSASFDSATNTTDIANPLLPYQGILNISSNTAQQHGGGVAASSIAIQNIADITISSNTALLGGGLFAQELAPMTNPNISIKNLYHLIMKTNTATQDGGGIYGTSIGINRAFSIDMNGNKAFKNGGAIFASSSCDLSNITTLNISNNLSKNKGGAIFAHQLSIQSIEETLDISLNSIATNVVAPSDVLQGGAIFSDQTVTISNVAFDASFEGNYINYIGGIDVAINGGAISSNTSVQLRNFNNKLSFDFNRAITSKSSTSKLIAGGAIFAPDISIQNCRVLSFTNNRAECTEGGIATTGTRVIPMGGALAANNSILISHNNDVTFENNSSHLGGAIACANDTLSSGDVTIHNNSSMFTRNHAAEHGGAIFAAGHLNIPEGNVSFIKNTSNFDGSVLYLRGSATIIANSYINFIDNKVRAHQQPTASGGTISTLGSAIYCEVSNVPLLLRAKSGDITFMDNGKNFNTSYCSISGSAVLTLQAAEDHSINFYDPILTTKIGSANLPTLNINESDVSGTYTGQIMFSGERHANVSSIQQDIILHDGSLIIQDGAQISALSFQQNPKSYLILGNNAILSNHSSRGGGITINNLGIDLSSILPDSDGILPTPPEIKLVNRTLPEDKVTISGIVSILNKDNSTYFNSYLGQDREFVILKLPTQTSQVTKPLNPDQFLLDGDFQPSKGYVGIWNLDYDNHGNLIARWTFDSYRPWAYTPREESYYLSSVIGSHFSLVTVKQDIINSMTQHARLDDPTYNNLWISSHGCFLNQKTESRKSGVNYHGKGYSLALDAKPQQDVLVGAAFSQIFSHAHPKRITDYNDEHSNSEHSYQFSLFTTRNLMMRQVRRHPNNQRSLVRRPVLIQGVISYAYMQHEAETLYPNIKERNEARWHNLAWLFDCRASLDLREPSENSPVRLSSFIEMEYISIRQSEFVEDFYDPRKFFATAYRNLTIPMGVVFEGATLFQYAIAYGKASFAYLPVLYRNKPSSTYMNMTSREISAINTATPAKSAFRMELSSHIQLTAFWSIYNSYTMHAGSDTLANMCSLGTRVVF